MSKVRVGQTKVLVSDVASTHARAMEYRFLGRTGVRISQLAFGTMSFGGDADEDTSAALYARVRDAGLNLFDCADVYAGGRSEEILGRLVREHRDEVVIATKAYFPTSSNVNGARLVALPPRARGGGEPAPAGHGPCRPVLSSPSRRRHTARRNAPRGRAPHHDGEDSLPRREQLCRLANAKGVGDRGATRLSADRVHPTDVQPRQAAGRRSRSSRWRAPKAWACSPTRHSAAGS